MCVLSAAGRGAHRTPRVPGAAAHLTRAAAGCLRGGTGPWCCAQTLLLPGCSLQGGGRRRAPREGRRNRSPTPAAASGLPHSQPLLSTCAQTAAAPSRAACAPLHISARSRTGRLAAGMTDILPQPDCSLKAVCESLEHCCLDQLEEPGSKRVPNTGARLWGRVRSKLLRQKVLAGLEGWRRDRRAAGLREGWGRWGLCLCTTAPAGSRKSQDRGWTVGMSML